MQRVNGILFQVNIMGLLVLTEITVQQHGGSETSIGSEPGTFWLSVRHFNHCGCLWCANKLLHRPKHRPYKLV